MTISFFQLVQRLIKLLKMAILAISFRHVALFPCLALPNILVLILAGKILEMKMYFQMFMYIHQ